MIWSSIVSLSVFPHKDNKAQLLRIMIRAVTFAYFFFERVNFCWLGIRLTIYNSLNFCKKKISIVSQVNKSWRVQTKNIQRSLAALIIKLTHRVKEVSRHPWQIKADKMQSESECPCVAWAKSPSRMFPLAPRNQATSKKKTKAVFLN